MRHDWRRIFLFMALALLVMSQAAAGLTNAPNPDKSASSGSTLHEKLSKARESFVKKDFHDAATEIRAASALLKEESTKAEGDVRQDLASSSRELDELADRIERKAVTSEKDLDQSFARAEYALAREYHGEASESWARKETSEAGNRLREAAASLENALVWASGKLEEESRKVIQAARSAADRMEKDADAAATEVGKSLEGVKDEIEKAAKKSPFQRTLSGPVITMAEKPKEPIDLNTAITRVAAQVMPAVVYIEVTQSRTMQNPLSPFESDPFFRRFFGMPRMPRQFKQETRGLGSGMIIDAEGHILTNSHVAAGATKIQVTLADGSRHPATLVGADPRTDLAVIRITGAGPLPHVTFGDSDMTEVGEWVVAIGAPRALEKSVTQGIISAKHRTGISDPNAYQDFLQTDAPINPGNSGGPLLNLYGQVIGVNAAIATESGGFEGIGFTIPSRMAVYVANALMAQGRVERGWLGVTIRNLTPELAKEAKVTGLTGALIVDVIKGGPAEKAGLKKNDVVIAYGESETPDSSALRNAVAQTPAGRQVKLTILREGKKEQVTVVIGDLGQATKVMAEAVKERLGADVRPPTPKEVEQYGLNQSQGVVISRLDSEGPLAKAGFEVDDMILAIDKQPVGGVDDFVSMVSVLPEGQRVSLTALDHRTGNTLNIFVVPK